jgi:hypothetical protein
MSYNLLADTYVRRGRGRGCTDLGGGGEYGLDIGCWLVLASQVYLPDVKDIGQLGFHEMQVVRALL